MNCPACGATNASENTFCIKCGARLDEPAPKPAPKPKPSPKRAASAKPTKPAEETAVTKGKGKKGQQSASEVARDLAFVVSDKDDKVTRFLIIGGCAGAIVSLFSPCVGMSQEAQSFFGAFFQQSGVVMNSSFNLLEISNLMNQLSRQLGSFGSGYATALTMVAAIALVGAVVALVCAIRRKMRVAKIVSWVTAAVMIVDLALVGSIPSQFEAAAKQLAASGQESMMSLMNMMANPWGSGYSTSASNTDVTLLLGFWLGLVAVLALGASAIRAASLRITEREKTFAEAKRKYGRH